MGATHKETVTELVKAMIQSGHVKAEANSKYPARDVLKKSILLVEYGVQYYRDPETIKLITDAYAKEKNGKKELPKSPPKLITDLNQFKKEKKGKPK